MPPAFLLTRPIALRSAFSESRGVLIYLRGVFIGNREMSFPFPVVRICATLFCVTVCWIHVRFLSEFYLDVVQINIVSIINSRSHLRLRQSRIATNTGTADRGRNICCFLFCSRLSAVEVINLLLSNFTVLQLCECPVFLS